MKNTGYLLRSLGLFAGFLLLLFLFFPDISVEDLLDHTPAEPVKAVAFILVLYCAKSLTVVFPLVVLEAVSGVLFPVWEAMLINTLGLSLVLTIPYFLGQSIGFATVEGLVNQYPKFRKIMEKQEKNTFFLSFFLRGLHCLPGDLITLYLGASKVPFWHNYLAGMLGLLPGMVLCTLIGQSIQDPSSPMFWLSAILMVCLSVSSMMLYRRKTKREEKT